MKCSQLLTHAIENELAVEPATHARSRDLILGESMEMPRRIPACLIVVIAGLLTACNHSDDSTKSKVTGTWLNVSAAGRRVLTLGQDMKFSETKLPAPSIERPMTGRPVLPHPTEGTWHLENDTLVLDVGDPSRARKLTLVTVTDRSLDLREEGNILNFQLMGGK